MGDVTREERGKGILNELDGILVGLTRTYRARTEFGEGSACRDMWSTGNSLGRVRNNSTMSIQTTYRVSALEPTQKHIHNELTFSSGQMSPGPLCSNDLRTMRGK